MRCKGRTYRSIGQELGVDEGTARRLIKRTQQELDAVLKQDALEVIQEQLEQLRQLQDAASACYFNKPDDAKLQTTILANLKYQADLLRLQDIALTSTKTDYTKYRTDPVRFASEVLGITLWGKQQEVLRALVKHKRVMCKSANGIGKSLVAAIAAVWFDATHKGICIVTGPKYDQVKDVSFKEIRRLLRKIPNYSGIQPKSPEIMHSPEHYLKASTASDPSAFQGIHGNELLFIFEEATGIDSAIWTSTKGNLTGGDHLYWLVILNPTDPSSHAYAEEQSGDWHVIEISALDHPNITAELKGEPAPIPSAVRLEQLRLNLKQWATVVEPESRQPIDFEFDGVLYRPKPECEARVLGRYPSQAAASIFDATLFEAAYTREPSYLVTDAIEIGCDVARFGDDMTVIHVKRGNTSLEHIVYHGQDTAWTSAKLKETARKWAAHFKDEKIDATKIAIRIDDSGVGGGVVDQRGEFNFIPINNACSPMDDDYPNTRSEILFTLAEKMVKISFAKLDHNTVVEMKRQASAINYKLDNKGRRVAQSKDDIKKKIGRSYDDLDAVGLAYYGREKRRIMVL